MQFMCVCVCVRGRAGLAREDSRQGVLSAPEDLVRFRATLDIWFVFVLTG